MSKRPRHPSKEIEGAVSYLESLGWTWHETGKSAHSWGKMLCPHHDRTGCTAYVWSTPRSADTHAKQLKGHGNKCAHGDMEAKDEDV